MLLCPWNFPGNSTGVGCHFLLQVIFPDQGSNPGHTFYSEWQLSSGIFESLSNTAYLVAQTVKILPAMQEALVWSLGREDLLQKGMATHSSILAWRIPWTEEHDRPYSPWGGKESDTTERLTLSLSWIQEASSSIMNFTNIAVPKMCSIAC